MPISVETTAGGTGYVDIRVGEGHGIHQALLDVAALAADADGYYPPGQPILASGAPVTQGVDTAEVAHAVIGPEPVKEGAANHFGNVILDGTLNRDAIEDNLGRALTANELSALADGGFKLI